MPKICLFIGHFGVESVPDPFIHECVYNLVYRFPTGEHVRERIKIDLHRFTGERVGEGRHVWSIVLTLHDY